MHDLQLVGFTTDRRGLIFRTTTGARAESFVVPITDELLAVVTELVEDRGPAAADDEVADADHQPVAEAPSSRPTSQLSVRDIQARLRAGEPAARVAAEAGVDEEWIERFAPPVRAEQRQVVDRALDCHLQRARGAPSAVPLRRAVGMAMADRGVAFTVSAFEAAWSAHLLGHDRWAVEFSYRHRGERTARWIYDAEADQLTTSDRTASQLGYVPETARVDPDAGAAVDGVVGDHTVDTPIGAPPPAKAPKARSSSRSAKRRPSAKAAGKKSAAKKAAGGTRRKKAATKKAAPKERAATKKGAAKEGAPKKRAATKKGAAKKGAPKKRAATKKAAAKKRAAKKGASRAQVRSREAAVGAHASGGTEPAARPAGPEAAGRAAGAAAVEPRAATEDGVGATPPSAGQRAEPTSNGRPASRTQPSAPADGRPVAPRPGAVGLREAPLASGPPAPRRPPELERVPDAADVVDTTGATEAVDVVDTTGATEAVDVVDATEAADPTDRTDARRARAAERAAPTVHFRSGSAVPVRRSDGTGGASPTARRRRQLRAR